MNIGIDIGGSHIAVGLVNENGVIIEKHEKDIFEIEKLDIENFLVNYITQAILKIIDNQNIDSNNITKIGISAPGCSNDGHIRNLVNLGIQDFNIAEQLKQNLKLNNIFTSIEISVLNDGKAAGLAEKKYGGLQKYNNCIYLCLGTGIGGAVFVNGNLVLGKQNPGFEIGHIIIDKHGRKCKCGSEGCFETYGSMKAFKMEVCEKFSLDIKLPGAELFSKIEDLVNENNVDINNIIDDYIENITIGLSNLINIFEPEAICIGGSFCYYKSIFYDRLIKSLKSCNYIFNKGLLPVVEISELGGNAGVIGSQI